MRWHLSEPYQQTCAELQRGTDPAAPALSPVLMMRLAEMWIAILVDKYLKRVKAGGRSSGTSAVAGLTGVERRITCI